MCKPLITWDQVIKNDMGIRKIDVIIVLDRNEYWSEKYILTTKGNLLYLFHIVNNPTAISKAQLLLLRTEIPWLLTTTYEVNRTIVYESHI